MQDRDINGRYINVINSECSYFSTVLLYHQNTDGTPEIGEVAVEAALSLIRDYGFECRINGPFYAKFIDSSGVVGYDQNIQYIFGHIKHPTGLEYHLATYNIFDCRRAIVEFVENVWPEVLDSTENSN